MNKRNYKTKEVAQQLHVSPGTVLKWVKRHEVPYSLNQHGHFLFDEEAIEIFFEIKEDNRQITSRQAPQKERPNAVSSQKLIERLAGLEDKMKLLERTVSNKADEIVSFQLMEHRKEVNTISDRLQEIEDRLKELEDYKKSIETSETKQENKKERKLLAGLFSV